MLRRISTSPTAVRDFTFERSTKPRLAGMTQSNEAEDDYYPAGDWEDVAVYISAGPGCRRYVCLIRADGFVTLPQELVDKLHISQTDELEWEFDIPEWTLYIRVKYKEWTVPEWLE